MTDTALGASFRDPSGFLFERDGVLLRRVQPVYAAHYDRLMESGLYERLTGAGLMIPHEEVDVETSGAHKILKPERIDFASS